MTLDFVVGLSGRGLLIKMEVLAYVLHVSSNANNGANAGTFTFNGNNDSGNRNRNIGTQLAVSSSWPKFPALRGKHDDPLSAW